MSAVITAEQAKKITGGRTPLVPVEYESAVKALQACTTLDEAKYWDSKADALAAWAKIYSNDEIGNEARKLKLHAYRRMGELSEQLRPTKKGGTSGLKKGGQNGALSLLKEKGLKTGSAKSARFLAKIPEQKFNKMLKQERPFTPQQAYKQSFRTSGAWRDVVVNSGGLMGFRGVCRRHKPDESALAMTSDEQERARAIALEVIDWLDAFEQALPKSKT